MLLAALLLLTVGVPRYEVTDLHLVVSYQKVVMNNRGSVAGTMMMPDGTEKVFVSIGGKVHFIGNGATDVGAINNLDDVVAIGNRNIVLWRRGVAQTFTHQGTASRPTVAGIDDKGNVLATFYDTQGTDGSYENFSYPLAKDKPRRNFQLIPVAVNNIGQVAGTIRHGRGPRGERSVLWTDGAIVDLGNLYPGPGALHITAMNDKGEIVGDTYTGNPLAMPFYHAFLWRNGKLTDLSDSTPKAKSYVTCSP